MVKPPRTSTSPNPGLEGGGSPTPPLAVAILAAGRGRRYNEGAAAPTGDSTVKALLEIGGIPLIRRALAVAWAAGARLIVPVLGYCARRVHSYIPENDPRIVPVINPDYARGQGSSLRAAAQLVASRLPGSALAVILVDMPLVRVQHLDRVWQCLCRALTHDPSGQWVARAFFEPTATPGHPVIFSPAAVQALTTIADDDDAPRLYVRQLARQGLVLRVPFDDDAVIFDIDTPGDYHQARERLDDPLGP